MIFFFHSFKLNGPRNSFNELLVYAKDDPKNFWQVLRCFYE